MSAKEGLNRTRVVAATASERRLAALHQIRGKGIQVDSFAGGDEPNIDNVMKIALGKMEHIFPMVVGSEAELDEKDQYERTLMIGADARTEIYRPKAKGNGNKGTFESKGKPKEAESVQEYFRLMAQQAENDGRGLYRVVASSAIQTVLTRIPERINTVAQTQSVEVHLNKASLKHLATPDGFAEYLARFEQFYDSELYRGEGFTPPTPSDLSGGISLPVLLNMGVVERVADQKITRKRIDSLMREVRKALLLVAVGYGPKVLREIDAGAYDQVLQWEWLNEVTRTALDMD